MEITNKVSWNESLSIGRVASQGLQMSVSVKPVIGFVFTDLEYDVMLQTYIVDGVQMTMDQQEMCDTYSSSTFTNEEGLYLSNLTSESACEMFMSITDKIIIRTLENGEIVDPELISRRAQLKEILTEDKIEDKLSDIVTAGTGKPLNEFVTDIYSVFSVLGS